MKRLIMILLLLFGVIASSYNQGRKKAPQPEFLIKWNNHLDSVNAVLDGKVK
ncbi:hypothetical protein [Sphingobacterium sp. BIGb0116]|uniref:hypothetical protein n=1 Tax=Sphingobacterium sp. BIGb0116 TaxID=2940619 RepID=UPI002168C82C|nr:hypothetical protein [Sphingobacterium sp. BIGb0116]MCS4164474.1 hypothetical protein [Sphingobacterium sp. BIGb0116]